MEIPYEPSKLEISKACRDIQRTWSQNEELKRRGAVDQVWLPLGLPCLPDVVVNLADDE